MFSIPVAIYATYDGQGRDIYMTYVNAVGVLGDNLTYSRAGVITQITVPYATKALQDSDGNAINTTYAKMDDTQALAAALARHDADIAGIMAWMATPEVATLLADAVTITSALNLGGIRIYRDASGIVCIDGSMYATGGIACGGTT